MTTSNPIQIILNEKQTTQQMVSIDIIKSPMKYEILDLLRHNEMNFDEIVEKTSRTKANISMHLKDLREEGIVNYKADPSDHRKKIFYLNCEFLGSIDSNNIKQSHKNQTKQLINDFIENGEIEFIVLLTHTLKSLLMEFGIDITPVLEKMGNYIGEYLFSQLYDEDIYIFIDNIISYWQKNRLGKLYFEIKNNITITCIDCFESSNVPKSGMPICSIEKGMFETLFNSYFKFDLNIKEKMCYSMGDKKCVYEIQP